MKRKIIISLLVISFLLMLGCNNNENTKVSTNTEIKTQDQSAKTNNLDEKQFSLVGNINGNLNIHMELSLNNGKITGTYYYDKYKQDLKLEGTYDSTNNVNLSEFDNKGNNTGKFSGILSTDGNFTGEWSTADNSKKMSFSLKNLAETVEIKEPSKAKENKNTSNDAFEDFDYSNRYIVKDFNPVDTSSNTGDSLVDSTWNTTWSLYNDTNRTINDANNNAKLYLTINWGFYPNQIFYEGKQVKISGTFFNNNAYATISKISNMKVFLYDANKNIVSVGDFSNQNAQFEQILIPYNKAVPYTFSLSNVTSGLDLSKYGVMISSDFETIPDEEKIRKDHPEVATAVDYYNKKASDAKDKYNSLQEKRTADINEAILKKAIDAASY